MYGKKKFQKEENVRKIIFQPRGKGSDRYYPFRNGFCNRGWNGSRYYGSAPGF